MIHTLSYIKALLTPVESLEQAGHTRLWFPLVVRAGQTKDSGHSMEDREAHRQQLLVGICHKPPRFIGCQIGLGPTYCTNRTKYILDRSINISYVDERLAPLSFLSLRV